LAQFGKSGLMYRILKPFNADGIYFKREQYVDDEFVDSWKIKIS